MLDRGHNVANPRIVPETATANRTRATTNAKLLAVMQIAIAPASAIAAESPVGQHLCPGITASLE